MKKINKIREKIYKNNLLSNIIFKLKINNDFFEKKYLIFN